MKSPPLPQKIKLHRKRKTLELIYQNGEQIELPAEYLRVFSPSAEVRGHGSGQETLQWGKKDVNIERIVAVGNYAIQPLFDDGHNTGIFSWDYLYRLHQEYAVNWARYIEQLADVDMSRDPAVQVLKL
jgi:DUF971 family protein